jgi:hypothetical protein
MSKYVFTKSQQSCRFPQDVEHIMEIFKAKGHEISFIDAELAWEDFSDDMCAGWMMMYEDDDHVFEIVASRCEKIDD